jgi:hypothetical protein
MYKKVDNWNIEAKLCLRKHFLEKYHRDSGRVFDACQGDGVLWSLLRSEYPHLEYWGVDFKRKPGRIKVDSSRILQIPQLPYDIVDVDTYGSPWKHWKALIPNISKPTTVFLTIGFVKIMGGTLPEEAKASLGLNRLSCKIPNGIVYFLNRLAVKYLLAEVIQYDIIIVEAWEAVSQGNARYIGLRLEPKLCE